VTYRNLPDIPIGSRWQKTLPFRDETGAPADFAGWSGRMQIRDDFGGTLIATLRVGATPANTATNSGTITFPGDGNVVLYLPATFTALLSEYGAAVYDVELINPAAEPDRVLEGRVKITQEVTTDA